MTQRAWMPAVIVLGLLLAFAAKGALLQPPQPPATVKTGEFDTGRALGRLQRILGDERPHPVDGPANDAVRNRLIAELRAIGLQPRIHESLDCSAAPKSRVVSCLRVRNVVATIGSGTGKHLLLNSHYDSTPTGPGAADDGMGVAAMLEVAALLQAQPPARPVAFLFNEGEEFGLNGASAFVREDPLADNIDSLINIEARGVNGPALMFETSEPNGAAIAAFRQAAGRPYANSLSMDFAKLIPNSTDVVEFRPEGWTTLNFAIIGNETRYHTPGDTIAALDRGSLHHVGSEVLAATRAMSGAGLVNGSGQKVFTDIAGRIFVAVPLPIAAVILALLIMLALTEAWRRKAFGRPLFLTAGMAVGSTAAVGLAGYVAGFLRAGDYWRAYPIVTYLAVYATMLLVALAMWRRWGSAHDPWAMRTAAWLFILGLAGIVGIVLPGTIIYFLAPPALALLGILLARRAPQWANGLVIAAALVQLLTLVQLLALIEMLLIDGPVAAVAPFATLAILPFVIEIDAKQVRAPVVGLAALSAALWLAAMLVPRASAERPAAFSIDYYRDDVTMRAQWGIAAKQAPLPDGFPGEWRKGVLDYSTRTRWTSDAPAIDVPAPGAEIVTSTPAGAGRRVALRLATNGANALSIRFAEGTKVQRLGLSGGETLPVPAMGQPKRALLRCSGRSCNGMVIEVLLADRRPVIADLFATTFALPLQGAALADLRPADAHPQYGPDSSVRRRRVKF